MGPAKPIRVRFKDMAQLGPAVKDFDALAWMSRQGQLFIFVSERHRAAPPQALAALLAHEALHHDLRNSVQEEIAGWRQEALVWERLRHGLPTVLQRANGHYPLIARLNRLLDAHQTGQLDALVRENPHYASLPEYSPGFDAFSAAAPVIP